MKHTDAEIEDAAQAGFWELFLSTQQRFEPLLSSHVRE